MNQKATSIRPVVIYPFSQPRDLKSLEALYAFLKDLTPAEGFSKPQTIINNQTKYRAIGDRAKSSAITLAYQKAIDDIIKPVSDVSEIWAVDTCAMWLNGLGVAFQNAQADKAIHDVFWLIPGDFEYASNPGSIALDLMKEIPMKVFSGEYEICLGEIKVPLNSAKQLIDTYGTYGLLYNWFPAEAQGIRAITDKPRTEFFAINYQTLERALIDSRWYAYEQTVMILLQNMAGKTPVRRITSISLGEITDDESTRSTLAAAMQQVERTERALKLFWREKAEREGTPNWHEEFRRLDAQSESVRTSAMVILRRLLT
jgi:hypothetical protein